MTSNFLKLPRLVVDSVTEDDHDYQVYVHAAQHPRDCPNCASRGLLVGFGHHTQVVKDRPLNGKRVTLHFDTFRFRCKDCGKTFLESHPDFHPKRAMTQRLYKWICVQGNKRTLARVAQETGVVEGTIRNVLKDWLATR